MKPEDKIRLARTFVAIYQSKTIYYHYYRPRRRSIGHQLLGISAGIIALPLILLLMLISFVVPQKQWEQFWDEFLELE